MLLYTQSSLRGFISRMRMDVQNLGGKWCLLDKLVVDEKGAIDGGGGTQGAVELRLFQPREGADRGS